MTMHVNIDCTETNTWKLLQAHYEEIQNTTLNNLFHQDPKRIDYLSFEEGKFFFDFSKNHLTQETIGLFKKLASEVNLELAKKAMFEGEKINQTENRAVLHTALRNLDNNPIYLDGENIMPLVFNELEKMKLYNQKVESGQHSGFTSKKINSIVNIGIGGSDLGPNMVCEALKPYWRNDVTPYFVSNIDGNHISNILKHLDPETTLFIIASKTFTTEETMTNAKTARHWFLKKGSLSDVSKHFVAVSTNEQKVTEFGIDANNMFKFWDWVGGRYSLWSTIGLSIVLTVGYDNFLSLLRGAEKMDKHFKEAPFEQNAPTLMAFLGVWYNNFFNAQTQAILPYDQLLAHFSKYLQQADMESNGKSIDRNGQTITHQTGQIIWGEPGTNGQHAFYQLIHQGTKIIPCDFIAAAKPPHALIAHQDILIANFIAQTEALMTGKSPETVEKQLKMQGLTDDEIKKLMPFKVFTGNRPTSTIFMNELTPETLGSLIALYEHKIFAQGVIWNVFSFDQWGVELGKQLAGTILKEIRNNSVNPQHDSSTQQIINKYLELKRT